MTSRALHQGGATLPFAPSSDHDGMVVFLRLVSLWVWQQYVVHRQWLLGYVYVKYTYVHHDLRTMWYFLRNSNILILPEICLKNGVRQVAPPRLVQSPPPRWGRFDFCAFVRPRWDGGVPKVVPLRVWQQYVVHRQWLLGDVYVKYTYVHYDLRTSTFLRDSNTLPLPEICLKNAVRQVAPQAGPEPSTKVGPLCLLRLHWTTLGWWCFCRHYRVKVVVACVTTIHSWVRYVYRLWTIDATYVETAPWKTNFSTQFSYKWSPKSRTKWLQVLVYIDPYSLGLCGVI